MLNVSAHKEFWPLTDTFKTPHSERFGAELIICEISDGEFTGSSEVFPLRREGEDGDKILAQIEKVAKKIGSISSIQEISSIVPNGAARAALDTAYWRLLAARENKSLWEISGLQKPKPLCVSCTIPVGDLAKTEEYAKRYKDKKIIKLKLVGDDLDHAKVKLVRSIAVKAELMLDANGSFSVEQYEKLIPLAKENNVALIEQPFKVGEDDYLANSERQIPVCADESCREFEDLASLRTKYDVVNIMLDRVGGLSAGIKIKQKAREMGFKVMIGSATTSSLAIRPAFYLAQDADYADLDGLTFLTYDHPDGLKIQDSIMSE